MKCPTCNGVGKFPSPAEICPVCSGSGNLSDNLIDNPPCTVCMGSGKYPSYTTICNNCSGYGKQPSAEGQFAVLYIESGTYRTAHIRLEQLCKELNGDICIFDPYYGTGSLYRLDALIHCDAIRFLTKKKVDDEVTFIDRAVSEFKKQYDHFQFRICGGKPPHDRYILTSDFLILLGHGLVDIGNKESFVVQFRRDLIESIWESVKQSFDNRWEKAKPLV